MTRYALDADILITIQKSGRAQAVKLPNDGSIVVTDSVWDELTTRAVLGGVSQQQADDAEKFLSKLAGAPMRIEPQTNEAQTFARLRQPPIPPTEGEGEHSVIAYAFHHLDVIGVFLDRRALHRAVEELRGRVLSLHGLLDVWRRGGAIGRADAAGISTHLRKKQVHLREPVWW